MDGIKSLNIIVILKYLNHISSVILWQRQFEDKMKVTIDLKINCLSCIFVTSRSGTLSELILWGHLLSSDLDYYAIKSFYFDYEALWVDDMLFYCIDIDGCYWLGLLSVQDFGPRGCRGIDGTPWTLDRVKECTIGVWLVYYDVRAFY